MDEKFFERLLATFRIEAEEHLRSIANDIVAYEQAALASPEKAEYIETVFREAHSLKGAARAVSLFDIQTVCQNLETVLSGLKSLEIRESPELIDACLSAVDCIRNYLNAGNDSEKNSAVRDCLNIGDRLVFLAEANSNTAPEHKQSEVIRTQRSKRSGRSASASELPLPNTPITPETEADKSVLSHQTPQTALPHISSAVEDKDSASANSNNAFHSDISKHGESHAQEIIRVPMSRLDALMALSEDLLPLRLQSHQITETQKLLLEDLKKAKREWNIFESELFAAGTGIDRGKTDDIISAMRGFFSSAESSLRQNLALSHQATRSLSGKTANLLDDVKGMLMLPFKELTDLFPKMCRDIARELGKEIELKISGGEVLADRRILEELKDPLTHLLRNAIDHGIEPPEKREISGKPRKGTLLLSIAASRGNMIEISLSDDGKGIDYTKLLEKAVEKGILSQDSASSVADKDILSLIFHSGLSTSTMITDLSGRGLGMAIVREKIRKLDGDIEVVSTPGTGSTFKLFLPPSKSGVRGIMVTVSGFSFILPTAKIEQTLRLPATDINRTGGTETFFYRNTTLPVTHLATLLGLRKKYEYISHYIIIIISGAEGKAALIVDAITDETDVVIKPFKKPIIRLPNMAGITIAGDGKIIPVLSAPDILVKALRGEASGITREQNTVSERKHKILVVDDSITSRMLIKDILESAGYLVKAFTDGMEALTAVKSESFDLVVSDVEMPRMNGFELTSAIRKTEGISSLPVILVTALARREDKERGVDAGANAYIIKGSFDQNNLLETLERLL